MPQQPHLNASSLHIYLHAQGLQHLPWQRQLAFLPGHMKLRVGAPAPELDLQEAAGRFGWRRLDPACGCM